MKEGVYYKTVKKLEAIIDQIENEEIGVDALAKKVKEAVGMIQYCKETIQKAEFQVKEVVNELEEEE